MLHNPSAARCLRTSARQSHVRDELWLRRARPDQGACPAGRGLPESSKDSLGDNVVHHDDYVFDGNGNLDSVTDYLPGSRGNRTMVYDALDRLTSATSPMFGRATYTYDGLDNLRTIDIAGRKHTYVYGTENRLDRINITGTNTAANVFFCLLFMLAT